MNARLEAFCDAVFAIAITLLILDVRVPRVDSVHSVDELWRDVGNLWPSFFALAFTFVIILISWIGHHNLLKGVDRTSARFQLANGYFMFTIILMPFFTAFMAEYLNTPFAQPAIVCFCLNTALHNTGWIAVHRSIVRAEPPLVTDAKALDAARNAYRGAKYGLALYAALCVVAWWQPYAALTISVLSWVFWLYVSVSLRSPELA